MRKYIKALKSLRGKVALLLCAFCLLTTTQTKATHIVAAFLHYECVNSAQNQYRVELRMWRDCLTGQAEFDDPIYLFAMPIANPNNYQIFEIPRPFNTPEIIPNQWTQCTGQTYNRCVEEAVYERLITLPPSTGGYDLGWARCCRNQLITNLLNPLDQGTTWLAHIPGPEDAICNSMPTFNQRMPTFICADEDFYFDHAATDVDGDSLVYELTRPYDGLNFQNVGAGNANFGSPPPVVSPTNVMGPPPYRFVNYNGPQYSESDPFGPNSADIDPQTGLLHINAPQVGTFVIAISVFEYRDGVLLSENKVDMQVTVETCLPQNDPPVITHTFQPTDSVNNDTLIIQALDQTCYTAILADSNNNQLAVQPISTIFSGPNAPTVTITGTNPLNIDVCWDSRCEFSGSTIELILMGWDLANCPIYNAAFDTVYIKILPPPEVVPFIDHDLSNVNSNGDTVIIDVGTQACYDMWVADTFGIGGPINYNVTVQELNGGGVWNPTVVPNLSFPDSIPLNVCFTAGCENLDRTYRLILEGILEDACPPNNRGWDTVYIRVPAIPNPPPVVTHDLTGNIFQDDTIYIDVHNTACYRFTVDDTFPALGGLSYNLVLQALDQQAAGGVQPVVNVISTTGSLNAEVCWFTTCANVNRMFRLITIGIQDNACSQTAATSDTVYIRVNDVINPPPIISHNFLPGFEVDGDTVIVAADSAACYEFSLRDTVVSSYLSVTYHTELLSTLDSTNHAIAVTLSDSTDTLIAGTVCVTPGCDFIDETLMVIITGKDTFDCNPVNWVYDTVYVRVVTPFNNPPVIQHFLGGLPTVGGVVEVVPQSEPYCYRVEVSDPDSAYADLTAEGVGNIFEDWWRYGNPAEISVSGSNPLIIDVCWAPSCYDSGEEFAIVICGRDTSRCALTPTVCDSVRFRVQDCSIEVQNVFTPNGDGINDDFIPYMVAGVQYYRMDIFDRWGREIFESENGAWDGTNKGQGNAAPEGVYYYVFEYQFFSARGVPLKETKVGWVTLMR